MTELYSLAEVLTATGGRATQLCGDSISGVSIDSRDVAPGELFVAIKGDRFDGHDFVAAALEKGAAAALVSEGRISGERLIAVPDALQGLVDLAKAARLRSSARIVGVTGSAGKTTTKEAIRTVLSAVRPTHASVQSFNNHWGVPLMVARMPREAAYGVFEIGMNHAGEITPLTRLVRPHVAVITNVAAAHLEFFASVEAIAEAKAEIFLGLEPDGVAVLNADHEYLPILIEHARRAGVSKIVTYGSSSRADWRLDQVDVGVGRTTALVRGPKGGFELELQAEGRHMAANALAAVVVTDLFGIATNTALLALRGFGAPEGRGMVVRLGTPELPLLLIDQSYNANSASMMAALEVFAAQPPPPGEKVLVLGDMLELGERGPALHAALKDAVLATGATRVYLVGMAMEALAEALGPSQITAHAQNIVEIEPTILGSLAYGDAVMVKGSKGVRLAGLVTSIRDRFA